MAAEGVSQVVDVCPIETFEYQDRDLCILEGTWTPLLFLLP